ncbi:uncharacterized protein LOC128229888 [Mya arenaria]|uniref:uncharacterized protein LOC128229888 n=1 Tax=Mya arenaria TaxID=6604 RepID=UPI0022E319CD|nr:uncharacterized protein LOC128229888 [Mya arenaria]
MSAFFVYAVTLIAACWAATTVSNTHSTHAHTTHVTREPTESETIFFQYNSHTHHLLIKTHKQKQGYYCYIYALTDDERVQVHTDSGLRAIEMHLLTLLTYAHTIDDVSTIKTSDVRMCSHFNAHAVNITDFYTLNF